MYGHTASPPCMSENIFEKIILKLIRKRRECNI